MVLFVCLFCVQVSIGQNLTYNLGVLEYEQQEELSPIIIIISAVAGGIVVIVIIILFVVCAIKSSRNDDMMKKMRKDMDQLESRVANECKEGLYTEGKALNRVVYRQVQTISRDFVLQRSALWLIQVQLLSICQFLSVSKGIL